MNKLITLVVILGWVSGCGDDDGGLLSGGGAGGSSTSSTTGMGGAGGGASSSTVRVAHFSPDAPALDFCFVPLDGEAIGPVLEESGVEQGFAFGEVTPYLTVKEGIYTVQVVTVDAVDCTEPILEFDNVAVPGGGFEVTAAALGFVDPGMDPPLGLMFWIDDNASPSPGQAKVRFIHASLNAPSVDVGVLPAGDAVLASDGLLFDDVPFKGVGVPPYREVNAFEDATLRVQSADAEAIGIDIPRVSLSAGTVTTVFAINDFSMAQGFVCQDVPGDGSCQLLPR